MCTPELTASIQSSSSSAGPLRTSASPSNRKSLQRLRAIQRIRHQGRTEARLDLVDNFDHRAQAPPGLVGPHPILALDRVVAQSGPCERSPRSSTGRQCSSSQAEQPDVADSTKPTWMSVVGRCPKNDGQVIINLAAVGPVQAGIAWCSAMGTPIRHATCFDNLISRASAGGQQCVTELSGD